MFIENWGLNVLYAVVFVPIWLLLDWIIKKYKFSNRLFNAFIVLNAIFSSPINLSIVIFGLYHSLWKYELFFSVAARSPIVDTVPRGVSFVLAMVVMAWVKYLLWTKFNNQSKTLESLLKHSVRYFFQLPFLALTYFAFATEDDISQALAAVFCLYCVFAVAIYMYLSGKYRYKPFWFKNKKILKKED